MQIPFFPIIILGVSIAKMEGAFVTARQRSPQKGSFVDHWPSVVVRRKNSTTGRITSPQVLAVTPVPNPTTLQSFVHNTDFWVFLAGIFPFAWATVEFWRRIAFGEAFGTGRDSVVIGMDDSPADSRGRRVLGRGALVTAFVLFALAFGTIGIVAYSVLTSGPPPEDFASLLSTADATSS